MAGVSTTECLTLFSLRHGHDPEAYLADVLDRLTRMTNRDDLGALLPSRWKAATVAEAARCA